MLENIYITFLYAKDALIFLKWNNIKENTMEWILFHS